MKFPYKRILIVGCGGAGKSTLARFMGKRFSIPIVHLDKLWWLPGWKERNCDDFDAMLKRELQKPCWIMDGNYLRTLRERLRFADVCIFLDIDVETCLLSVRERAQLYAGRSRPDMPDGCPETLHADFEGYAGSVIRCGRGFCIRSKRAVLIFIGSKTGKVPRHGF